MNKPNGRTDNYYRDVDYLTGDNDNAHKFHQYIVGYQGNVYAIIEDNEGKVLKASINEIRFLDDLYHISDMSFSEDGDYIEENRLS